MPDLQVMQGFNTAVVFFLISSTNHHQILGILDFRFQFFLVALYIYIYRYVYIYISRYIDILVGGFNHLEKYQLVNGFRMTSHIWKINHSCSSHHQPDGVT